jgi:hypothetical protein
MIEVPHLCRIECNGAFFLPIHLHAYLRTVDPFDGSEVTIGDAQFAVCGRELDAVALGKVPADLAVCRDPAQPFRVVGDLLSVFFGDGDSVGCGVNRGNGRIRAWFDPMLLAATRVVQNVTLLVVRCPLPIDAGKLRSLRQNIHLVIVFRDNAGAF